jgi:hypothetical protein
MTVMRISVPRRQYRRVLRATRVLGGPGGRDSESEMTDTSSGPSSSAQAQTRCLTPPLGRLLPKQPEINGTPTARVCSDAAILSASWTSLTSARGVQKHFWSCSAKWHGVTSRNPGGGDSLAKVAAAWAGVTSRCGGAGSGTEPRCSAALVMRTAASASAPSTATASSAVRTGRGMGPVSARSPTCIRRSPSALG